MYKNTNILSYFKPFTQLTPLTKHSLPDESLEEPRAIRRRRSSTPKESQLKERDDGEEKYLDQTLNQTSSKVILKSLTRQPPDPQIDEPTDWPTPTQVFGDNNSHIPFTPLPNDPTLRNPDVFGSQTTSLMSGQRVVRNGQVVIRNSDDEFDSDSSLEDLNHLLQLEGRNSRSVSSCLHPPKFASSIHEGIKDERRTSARRRTKTDTIAAPLPAGLPVQPKKYKFDLELLSRRRKQEDASSEDITRASMMLRSFGQQKASANGSCVAVPTKKPFDTVFIDKVMKEHGEEEDIIRLKAAIQRTEALYQGKSWSFFDEQGTETLSEQMKFPVIEDRLDRMLGKTFSREQSFLSGYIGELAMKEHLPQELLLWIMDALCLESRDDLRHSYAAALTDASPHLVSILSPERISMLFRKIGASTAALAIGQPVIPRPALSQSIEAFSHPNLLSILGLFHNLASVLSAEIRMHLICILCRLVLDHSITNSCHILSSLEDLFASLIESIPEEDLDREVGDEDGAEQD